MSNPLYPLIEDEYWEKIKREEPIVAIMKCEEAAKQVINLTALLSTAYLGVISFSDILKQPMFLRPALLFVLLPLPFWLISLTLATRVIVPRSYVVEQIKDDYIKISRVKYTFLQRSYVFLITSLFALVAVLLLFLLYVPPPPA